MHLNVQLFRNLHSDRGKANSPDVAQQCALSMRVCRASLKGKPEGKPEGKA